jgi:hypothetical protein
MHVLCSVISESTREIVAVDVDWVVRDSDIHTPLYLDLEIGHIMGGAREHFWKAMPACFYKLEKFGFLATQLRVHCQRSQVGSLTGEFHHVPTKILCGVRREDHSPALAPMDQSKIL